MRSPIVPSFVAVILLMAGEGGFAAPLQDAAKAGDVESVGELLDDGADVNETDTFGTALYWAVMNGHDDVAALLIERGADVDASSEALGTPLHAAARRGRDTLAELLLESGTNVDATDRNAFTPLHLAAFEGHVAVAEVLLEHGADPNALGHVRGGIVLGHGAVPPLHYAENRGHAEVAEMLRKAGAGPPPPEPIDALMAEASAERGHEIARVKCRECHVYERDQPERMSINAGPTLVGVVGRKVAAVPGFDYSPALRRHGGTWTEERIYAFVSHPMMVVPGTRMSFDQVPDDRDRADLVAYLRTLTD